MLSLWLDNFIGFFSPTRGVQRLHARATMEGIKKFLGGSGGPYKAAEVNRFNRPAQNLNENAVPSARLEALAARSWDLYRDNKHARKIVRQICAKVIGNGMQPTSQATKADGNPFLEFRIRAKQVWDQVQKELDANGKPCRGGQHFADLAKTALRKVVLSGTVLVRIKPLTSDQQAQRGLRLPLVVQLIDPARLDINMDASGENRIYRGIEFDSEGQRVAYHILPYHPSDPRGNGAIAESIRVPAAEIVHIYETEDVDQVTGVPWFAAALDPLRDVGDYEYSELKAAAVGACVVMMVKRASGAGGVGLQAPTGEDNTDIDGNRISRMQPGMVFQGGPEDKIEGFNPQRPNTSAEGFIQHLLNSTAGAVPGVKGSTLHGDYRGSSFASERSADNEVWPEMEALQQWFSGGCYQTAWEAVITAAVLAGMFDKVPGFKPADFMQRKAEYLAATWQGPVPRSINPKDDADAAEARVANGTSSPQIEAAALGRNSLDILNDVKEFVAQVDTLGLPDDVKKLVLISSLGLSRVKGAPPPVAPDDAAPAPAKKKKTNGTKAIAANGTELLNGRFRIEDHRLVRNHG